MWAVLSTVAAVSVCAALFFLFPYSPTSAAYRRITNEKIGAESAGSEVFTEADIDGLPSPVQNCFRFCGYLDTPKMPYMNWNMGTSIGLCAAAGVVLGALLQNLHLWLGAGAGVGVVLGAVSLLYKQKGQ